MRNLSSFFLPVLAAAGAFGVFYIWAGLRPLISGDRVTGAFLIVFGIGGCALALALWQTWRRLTRL